MTPLALQLVANVDESSGTDRADPVRSLGVTGIGRAKRIGFLVGTCHDSPPVRSGGKRQRRILTDRNRLGNRTCSHPGSVAHQAKPKPVELVAHDGAKIAADRLLACECQGERLPGCFDFD